MPFATNGSICLMKSGLRVAVCLGYHSCEKIVLLNLELFKLNCAGYMYVVHDDLDNSGVVFAV